MCERKVVANPIGAKNLPPIPNLAKTVFDCGEIQSRDLSIAEYIQLYYQEVACDSNASIKISSVEGIERSRILKKLNQRFPGYPTDCVVFRINDGYTDIAVALPFSFMPGGFDKVDWFIVYNQARQPVALVPLLAHNSMVHIRKYTRAFCDYSCVFFVNDRLCYDDTDFDAEYDWGWFPLTPDVEEDLNNGKD